MSIGITLSLVFLASVIVVPALLGAYSRRVKRRYQNGIAAGTAPLERVRRAERFWFQASPVVLIVAIALAILAALQAR